MTRITTLNLHGRFDWQGRGPRVVSYLREQDPDIVFFQEVVYLPELSPYNQPSLMNRQLRYPYEQEIITRLQKSTVFENYREGLAVLSKYPIKKTEALVLKQDAADHLQRIVQLIDIDYHGHTVKYANVHFAEEPSMAADHLRELLALLERRHERRIIIGDYNIPNLNDYKFWRHGYNSSSSIPYASKVDDGTRIDYMLMPKSDLMVELQLSPDNLSDHRALTIDINLKVI